MQITVNGKAYRLPDGSTVGHLLNDLRVRRDAIAVEVNREIVARAHHATTALRAGDIIEIVTFVGGG